MFAFSCARLCIVYVVYLIREGRLIKRFLIMLHAKRSPNTSTQGPVSACPDMPSGPALPFTVEDPTGRCCTIDERLTTVKKNSKSALGAGGGWEQEAAVGPQVVKAFINYFSKDVRLKMTSA